MSIRCLMRLDAIVPNTWGGWQAMFSCSYDDKLAEEGRSFQKATPNGSATYQIDNPAAIQQLVVGEYYYVDFVQRKPDAT